MSLHNFDPPHGFKAYYSLCDDRACNCWAVERCTGEPQCSTRTGMIIYYEYSNGDRLSDDGVEGEYL